MTSPVRQQIVDAIVDRLEEIAVDKVYSLPFGEHTCTSTIKGVYPWRKAPFSKQEVPAIKLDDEDASVRPGPVGEHEHGLKINLTVHVAGSTAASVARSLLADIVACIGSDPRWSGLAVWTELEAHALDVEQAGDIIAAIQVLFTVTYRTPLWRM